ncbi:MAG: putative siderophore transport system ATP-binding protein YusV [Pseudomonadota bacterium]|jgi:iron complex transport system ATP-binding protein
MNALQTVALTAHNITVMHDEFKAVNNVSLTLHAGEWVSLVGPNGAGKSSLLKALAGLAPAEGQVSLLGKPWAVWSRRERAQTLAWMGQAEAGQDDLTVYDVAMLGRLPHQSWLSTPSAKDHAVVEVALKTVQAWDWRTRSLGQLSGGERQRVLLARALAVQAQVYLMDEPLAGVDVPHQADWLEWVRCLTETGAAVVSVLHELNLALQADRVWVMSEGRWVHSGLPNDKETHQALSAVFQNRLQWREWQDEGVTRWVALPK